MRLWASGWRIWNAAQQLEPALPAVPHNCVCLRPDLRLLPIRGNVDTRLKKRESGEFDAILLAAAGLERLGWGHHIAEVFTPEQVCPAPGQGALGIQTRNHGEALEICRRLNHGASNMAVTAERAVLAGLGGGCQLPVGATHIWMASCFPFQA